jgi:hypothetical protein
MITRPSLEVDEFNNFKISVNEFKEIFNIIKKSLFDFPGINHVMEPGIGMVPDSIGKTNNSVCNFLKLSLYLFRGKHLKPAGFCLVNHPLLFRATE